MGFAHGGLARSTLVCFPAAGGAASSFYPWSRAFSGKVRLIAVQPAGRESRLREAPSRTIDAYLADIAPDLVEHCRPPYALFGHSLGAFVAFEVAHLLSSWGLSKPSALMVSACSAPHVRRPRGLAKSSDDILVRQLNEFGGTPPEILQDAVLRRIALDAYRADLEVYEGYQPRDRPRLDIPFIAFAGERDPYVHSDDVQAWQSHTQAEFYRETVSAGHMYFRDEAFIGRVGEWLQRVGLVTSTASRTAR